MKEESHFLKAPGLSNFFYLARYANLTPEEREMYRTAQQREWDNKNVLDYAVKVSHEERALAKAIEIALEMVSNGFDVGMIIKVTKLSKEQIQAQIFQSKR